MSSADARRKNLEAKRKRLEELRQLRQTRTRDDVAPADEAVGEEGREGMATGSLATAAGSPLGTLQELSAAPSAGASVDIDQLVAGLLSAPVPDQRGGGGAAAAVGAAGASAAAAADGPHAPPRAPAATRTVSLSVQSDVAGWHIHRKVAETYAKATQTSPPLSPSHAFSPSRRRSSGRDSAAEAAGAVPAARRVSVQSAAAGSDVDDEGSEHGSHAVSRPQPLSEEEVVEHMRSEGFVRFLSSTSRLVERALHQTRVFDVVADFSGKCEEAAQLEEAAKCQLHTGARLAERSVTDIAWSHAHKELLLVAYSARVGVREDDFFDVAGHTDPDGLVLAWSTLVPTRPEFIFTCQSAVLAVCFHPFAPAVVLGSTYSGQIVQWSLDAGPAPLRRTPLSVLAHTLPVFCMAVVGTSNAHSLMTISTDGRQCLWSPTQLSEPQEEPVVLHSARATGGKDGAEATAVLPKEGSEVAATCLALFPQEPNMFIVGTESGAVVRGQIRGSARREVETLARAHAAPITSIHAWVPPNTQLRSDPAATLSPTAPLCSFDLHRDCVLDARWCPSHPALFATIDGDGWLYIWNINVDLEEPAVKYRVSEGLALNKLQWASDGRQIAVGDAAGFVRVLEISSEVTTPRPDELSRLHDALSRLHDALARAGRTAPSGEGVMSFSR